MKTVSTYAEAAEYLGRRESKYENLQKEAISTGDRFQKNSAELMLDRVRKFKDELFAEQEYTKAPQAGYGGETKRFAFGGEPPYRSMRSPVEVGGEFDPLFPMPPKPVQPFGFTPKAERDLSGFPSGIPLRTSFSPVENMSYFEREPVNITPMQSKGMPELKSTPVSLGSPEFRGDVSSGGRFPFGKLNLGSVEKAGLVSLASMFMANRTANQMQRPIRPKALAPPRINTTVNVADQMNDIDQDTMSLERSLVRSGLPGVNAMAIGRRTNADRLKANIFAGKRAQEIQLENSQSQMNYQNDVLNNNMSNQFVESTRQFENDKLSFRQRSSAEALTGLQSAMRDKSMGELDIQKAKIIRAGYSDPVTAETIPADLTSGLDRAGLLRKYGEQQIVNYAKITSPEIKERLRLMFPDLIF